MPEAPPGGALKDTGTCGDGDNATGEAEGQRARLGRTLLSPIPQDQDVTLQRDPLSPSPACSGRGQEFWANGNSFLFEGGGWSEIEEVERGGGSVFQGEG